MSLGYKKRKLVSLVKRIAVAALLKKMLKVWKDYNCLSFLFVQMGCSCKAGSLFH